MMLDYLRVVATVFLMFIFLAALRGYIHVGLH